MRQGAVAVGPSRRTPRRRRLRFAFCTRAWRFRRHVSIFLSKLDAFLLSNIFPALLYHNEGRQKMQTVFFNPAGRSLLPTGCATQDRNCLLVMTSLQRVWKCSCLSINTKVHLYQAPVMSVLAALWCRNMDPLGCRHKYTGGTPHKVSPTDT